jgi:serine/threonine protein kinase
MPQKSLKSNLLARRSKGAQMVPLAYQKFQCVQVQLEHEPEICELYEVKNVLGSGCMSTVYRASLRRTPGTDVALKILKDCKDAEAVQSAWQEFKILKRLPPHPHVVQALSFHELRTHGPALVLDFFDGPTLHELVTTTEARRLPEASVCPIGLALFQAVAHLHKHQVIHRDIKPQNVFVSRCLRNIQLGDFNVAKLYVEGEPCTPVGDVLYRAPEVLSGEAPSESSDVWSTGLCLFFALYGSITHKSRINALKTQASSLENVSALVKATLSAALSRQPSSRPSAAEVALESVWLSLN